MFQIKNRFSGAVIFECELIAEVESASYGFKLGFAVKKAIEVKVSLTGADLTRADLTYADLTRADLMGADLRGAYLRDADLRGAYLRDADLRGAYLRGADLTDADLRGAYLMDADLRGAYLTGAYLTEANLTGANLRAIKADIFMVLAYAIHEIPALIDALKTGKVDGSTYVGECCCLVGTIANARHCEPVELQDSIRPYSSRPAERFFMGIKKGDTPETNQVSKLALEWAEEFLSLVTPNA